MVEYELMHTCFKEVMVLPATDKYNFSGKNGVTNTTKIIIF